MIDSHAHLTNPQMLPDIETVLARAAQAGIVHIVNICTDAPSLKEGIALKKRFPHLLSNTAATTPHDVETEGASFFPLVETAAKAGDLVAIGETGLDYFYKHSPIERQQHYLVSYMHLALSTKLPLIFHCRDAFADLFAIADREYKSQNAILHCFTGTKEEAQGVVDRGWLLSLSGILTFKKSEALREVARLVPLSHLLIETDAPYLAPQKQRGKRNEPAYLRETAERLAEVKGLPVEQVIEQTTENAKRIFGF
jgi:TatD DNase family protein